ncbi:MAG TPA: hypothetical protein VM687_02085 [Stenotrophomonas sp.]|nr:hypothetical protein [Stenotrophomonas sp.]
MRIGLVEQEVHALGVLGVGGRAIIVAMMMILPGGGHRMLGSVQVAEEIQHRPHQCTQQQQREEAAAEERGEVCRKSNHGR